MRRGELTMWLAALFLGLTLVVAIFAGAVAPYRANEQDIARRLQPPALGPHLLGTDEVGRDVLSRLIYGARISLLVGVVAVALSCPLGVFVGVLAGYAGRRTDDVLMRVTEIQLAIPAILLAIAVVAVLGPGIRNVILTLSVTGWTLYARLTRGETLGVKARDFVQAARATGAGDLRIMTHHVLPNVLSPVIVVAVFAVANMIILEATLSFLGLGVEPDVVTWGRMLNGGRLYLSTAWWITAFPGLAIFLTVLAVNLLGDQLRDWLDPRLRNTLRSHQLEGRDESPQRRPEDRSRRGGSLGGRRLPLRLCLDRVPTEPRFGPGCSRHGDLLLRDPAQERPAQHLLQPAPDRGVRVRALPPCRLPPLLVCRAGEGADHLGPETESGGLTVGKLPFLLSVEVETRLGHLDGEHRVGRVRRAVIGGTAWHHSQIGLGLRLPVQRDGCLDDLGSRPRQS